MYYSLMKIKWYCGERNKIVLNDISWFLPVYKFQTNSLKYFILPKKIELCYKFYVFKGVYQKGQFIFIESGELGQVG